MATPQDKIIEAQEAEIHRLKTELSDVVSKTAELQKEYDELITSQDVFRENLETFRSKRNTLQQDVQDTRIKVMEISSCCAHNQCFGY